MEGGGKKGKSRKKRQMKCRSVEMCSGQFLSLFLSLSLAQQQKRLKEIGGESASHPHLPLSYLAQADRSSDSAIA